MKEFTPADIQQAYATTRQMLDDGIEPPLLYEHPPLDSDEGKPASRRDRAARDARNTAGWMKGSRIKNGILELLFEVPDENDAEAIRSGKNRFVSPEVFSTWRDKYKTAITHVAITPKPMNWNQTGFEEVALQMSELPGGEAIRVANSEDFQMADQTATGNSPSSEQMDAGSTTPSNPDLPTEDKAGQKLEAVLELLRTVVGIDLPADTELGSLLDGLLTGLKTLAQQQQKKAAEDASEKGDATTEEPQGAQMSEQEHATLTNLRSQLAAERTKGITANLERLRDKVSPPLFKRLSDAVGGVQMSEAGEEEPTIRVSELIDWLNDNTNPQDLTGQMSDVTETGHHGGKEFTDGDGSGDPSDDDVEAELNRAKRADDAGYLGHAMTAQG